MPVQRPSHRIKNKDVFLCLSACCYSSIRSARPNARARPLSGEFLFTPSTLLQRPRVPKKGAGRLRCPRGARCPTPPAPDTCTPQQRPQRCAQRQRSGLLHKASGDPFFFWTGRPCNGGPPCGPLRSTPAPQIPARSHATHAPLSATPLRSTRTARLSICNAATAAYGQGANLLLRSAQSGTTSICNTILPHASVDFHVAASALAFSTHAPFLKGAPVQLR